MNNEVRILDLLDSGCTPAFIADVMHIPFQWVARYVDIFQEEAEMSADADAEAYGRIE